ncbi:MAG: CPBP family intramembrane metalloprotease [Eubacterium sp.]
MNNYYQPPNFNNPYSHNYNETAMKNAYYIEKAALERKQIRHLGNLFGLAMTAYVILNIIVSLIVSVPKIYELYTNSALFQTCFGILAIDLIGLVAVFGIMAYINRKKYTEPLIPSDKLSFKDHFLWISFGMLGCIAANYVVSFMVYILQLAGLDPKSPDVPEPDSFITSIAIAIGTAIMPAICEEFAMRCCGIGMLKKYGKAFAVVSISIVFGLMHANLIQFVFATAVGLILGYVTVKTNSIIPAVFIHMFNNGISVITSIAEYVLKTESANSIMFWYALWLVLGGVSAIVMLLKGYFKNKEPRAVYEPYQNSLAKKVSSFFFVPGMIIPFLFFVSMIISSTLQ